MEYQWTRSVNSARSSSSHSPSSVAARVSGAGRPREQEPLELPRGGRGAFEAGCGHDLVGLGDPAGQRGDLSVGDRSRESAQCPVEALAGGDLHADIDLLVRHRAAGQVLLVLHQVLPPAPERGGGVGVMGLRPAADRVRAGAHPQVDLSAGELGVGVGAVDDQLLAYGVGPEGPALGVEEVPGLDPLRGDGAVARDAAQGKS